jgi:hypothetical protein
VAKTGLWPANPALTSLEGAGLDRCSEIPCPGELKEHSTVALHVCTLFLLSDSVSNQKSSFEHLVTVHSNWVSSSYNSTRERLEGKVFSFVNVVRLLHSISTRIFYSTVSKLSCVKL